MFTKKEYTPRFFFHKVYGHINFPFEETHGFNEIINGLHFDWLPLREADFELSQDGVLKETAYTSFSQIVDEDLPGYQYELVDKEQGYFTIEFIDTVKQEVKGRFKAQFKRTSKNGYKDLGLPENLNFEGIFYEKYEIK